MNNEKLPLKARVKDGLSSFTWELRNKKNHLKDKISKRYEQFTKTSFGGGLHKFIFEPLGKVKKNNFIKGLLYLSPALILLIIFTFYPIINTFILSIYENYNIKTNEIDGITLDNFKVVIKNPYFLDIVRNTMIIVFVSVPISVVISLFIAVMLNSIKRLRSFFQTIFFLPYVTNSIAIGIVFSYMFNYQYGIINKVIEALGGDPIHWLDPKASWGMAMTTLLIYIIWGSLAFKILVFTAGLQNIDKQYYDAAKVDGASRWRTFTKITVPLLSPTIAYITITSLIGAFKTYTSVVGLVGERGETSGGKDLRTFVFFVYENITGGDVLSDGTISVGAAASIILFGIILFFTLIQLYISKKRVHY